MRQLKEEWAAEIVGKLYRFNMTHKDFAKECGYTAGYLSMVLNGKKKFGSPYSERMTRKHILNTMARLEDEILG